MTCVSSRSSVSLIAAVGRSRGNHNLIDMCMFPVLEGLLAYGVFPFTGAGLGAWGGEQELELCK